MRTLNLFRVKWCACTAMFVFCTFAPSASAQTNNIWPLEVSTDVETRPNSSPLLVGEFSVEVRKTSQGSSSFRNIKLKASLQDVLGQEFLSFEQRLSHELAECLSERRSLFCFEENIFLPTALLEKACTMKVELSSGRRTVAQADGVSVGNCQAPIEFDDQYDFVAENGWSARPHGSLPGHSYVGVNIASHGQNTNHRALRVGAVVKDSENKILWSEILYFDDNLRRGRVEEVFFKRAVSPKVMHLGCSLSVHVNIRGDFDESDYSNNDRLMEFGDCLTPNPDNVDIVPSLALGQEDIELTLKNMGEVDVEGPVSLRVVLRDENQRRISDFVEKVESGVIEAYGGQFKWNILNADNVCSVEVLVDPRYEIQNENRRNNQIQLDICE